ncbi:PAS domain-containing protein [Pseudozobellia thermophila]|uniref:histidine kinase n=1 Tax=Pseudozobellia thermophila TaxID=192903 RepID=A0A1M6LT99_9FLAO|nr:PAS domain-containing protein [Pseudozobellia thermophila]SHJ74336.1 PAS domain S-box-containing protein [Pseudozobellia thermophila]
MYERIKSFAKSRNEPGNSNVPPGLLEKANEIGRIGVFELNIATGAVYWNNMLREIYEVPDNYIPDFESMLVFCKEEGDRNIMFRAHAEAIEKGSPFEFDIPISTAKGQHRHIWITAQPEFIDDGCHTIYGVVIDITGPKKTEASLLQKKHQWDFAEQLSAIGHWRYNVITTDFEWSDNVYRIYDFDIGTSINFEKYLTHLHPDDRQMVSDITEEFKRTKKFRKFKHRALHRDGSVRTVEMMGSVISSTNNQAIEIFGTIQDITDRIDSQKDLQLKNQLLTFTTEMTKVGYWQWDTVNNQETWSDNLYDMFGREKTGNLTYETYMEYVHPKDVDYVVAQIKKAFEDHEFPIFEHRIILKDGTVKTIQLMGKVFCNEAGEVIEIIGTCQDITESKATQIELLRKNELLNLSNELTNVGYWQWDTVNDVVIWSENLYRIFGRHEKSQLSFATYFSYVHPKDGDMVNQNFEASFKNKAFKSFTHRIVLADGTEKVIELTGKVIANKAGKIVEIIGTCQDITRTKRTEQELIRKNHLLNMAEKIAMIGYWQWNLTDGKIVWSDNLYRISDIEMGTEIDSEKYLASVHPEDREPLRKYMREILQTKKFERFFHRIIKKDGSIRTIEVIGEVIIGKDGRVTEIMGTSQDVTEQRMAEIKFRGLLESAPDAFVVMDTDGIIKLVNKQTENLYGYSSEELVGTNYFDLVPEDLQDLFLLDKERFRNNPFQGPIVPSTNSLYIINKEGNKIPVQISVGPVETAEGLLVTAAIRDITEQKTNEDKILEANRNLKESTDRLTLQNQQLAEFNHITSHNLRAPVSNLNSLLHLYREENSTVKKEALFEKFETVIAHLTLTLNTLIESLKVKNSTAKSTETISLDDTLKKTKEILAAEILNTKAHITSDFKEIPKISYNKIYIESIFLNLIGNAIKYSSENRAPKIEVASYNENGRVTLSFKDNGLGIDLNRHGHKIFGLNKVFHRHPDAKGIGLFLTKAQVEAMGGSISVESQVDVGSTFIIKLN